MRSRHSRLSEQCSTLRTVGLKDPRAFPPQPSEALGSSLRLDALAGLTCHTVPPLGNAITVGVLGLAKARTRPSALRTSAARPKGLRKRVRLVVVFIAIAGQPRHGNRRSRKGSGWREDSRCRQGVDHRRLPPATGSPRSKRLIAKHLTKQTEPTQREGLAVQRITTANTGAISHSSFELSPAASEADYSVGSLHPPPAMARPTRSVR
jgi:hypothetical protein